MASIHVIDMTDMTEDAEVENPLLTTENTPTENTPTENTADSTDVVLNVEKLKKEKNNTSKRYNAAQNFFKSIGHDIGNMRVSMMHYMPKPKVNQLLKDECLVLSPFFYYLYMVMHGFLRLDNSTFYPNAYEEEQNDVNMFECMTQYTKKKEKNEPYEHDLKHWSMEKQRLEKEIEHAAETYNKTNGDENRVVPQFKQRPEETYVEYQRRLHAERIRHAAAEEERKRDELKAYKRSLKSSLLQAKEWCQKLESSVRPYTVKEACGWLQKEHGHKGNQWGKTTRKPPQLAPSVWLKILTEYLDFDRISGRGLINGKKEVMDELIGMRSSNNDKLVVCVYRERAYSHYFNKIGILSFKSFRFPSRNCNTMLPKDWTTQAELLKQSRCLFSFFEKAVGTMKKVLNKEDDHASDNFSRCVLAYYMFSCMHKRKEVSVLPEFRSLTNQYLEDTKKESASKPRTAFTLLQLYTCLYDSLRLVQGKNNATMFKTIREHGRMYQLRKDKMKSLKFGERRLKKACYVELAFAVPHSGYGGDRKTISYGMNFYPNKQKNEVVFKDVLRLFVEKVLSDTTLHLVVPSNKNRMYLPFDVSEEYDIELEQHQFLRTPPRRDNPYHGGSFQYYLSFYDRRLLYENMRDSEGKVYMFEFVDDPRETSLVEFEFRKYDRCCLSSDYVEYGKVQSHRLPPTTNMIGFCSRFLDRLNIDDIPVLHKQQNGQDIVVNEDTTVGDIVANLTTKYWSPVIIRFAPKPVRIVGRIQCTETERKQRIYNDLKAWKCFDFKTMVDVTCGNKRKEFHLFKGNNTVSLAMLLYCFERSFVDPECIVMDEVRYRFNDSPVELKTYTGKQTSYTMEECNKMIKNKGQYRWYPEFLLQQIPYQCSEEKNDVVMSYFDYILENFNKRLRKKCDRTLSKHVVRYRLVGENCSVSRSKLSNEETVVFVHPLYVDTIPMNALTGKTKLAFFSAYGGFEYKNYKKVIKVFGYEYDCLVSFRGSSVNVVFKYGKERISYPSFVKFLKHVPRNYTNTDHPIYMGNDAERIVACYDMDRLVDCAPHYEYGRKVVAVEEEEHRFTLEVYEKKGYMCQNSSWHLSEFYRRKWILEAFHEKFYFDEATGVAYPKDNFKRRKEENEDPIACKRVEVHKFTNGTSSVEEFTVLMLLHESIAEFLMRRFHDFEFSMGVTCEGGKELFLGYDIELTMGCKEFLDVYWKEGSRLNMYRVNKSHREKEWNNLLTDRERIDRQIRTLQERTAETEEAEAEKRTMIGLEKKVKDAVVEKMEEIQAENNGVRKHFVFYPLIYYRANRQHFDFKGEDPIMLQEFLTTDMSAEESFYRGDFQWSYHLRPYYSLAIVELQNKVKKLVNMKHYRKSFLKYSRCPLTNKELKRSCGWKIRKFRSYDIGMMNTLPVFQLEYEEQQEPPQQEDSDDDVVVLFEYPLL